MYEDILYECLTIPNDGDRNAVLLRFLRYKATQRLFATCQELCEHDSSHMVRFYAAAGLLWCAGIIDNPTSIGINPYRYLINGMASDDISETKKAFEEFESLNQSNFH